MRYSFGRLVLSIFLIVTGTVTTVAKSEPANITDDGRAENQGTVATVAKSEPANITDDGRAENQDYPDYQQKVNEINTLFDSASSAIVKATGMLKDSRNNEEIINNALDTSQSKVRRMLNFFKTRGAFVTEIRLTLKYRRDKLASYESVELTEEQRKVIVSNENEIIKKFESLQKRATDFFKKIEELDSTFEKTRRYIALLMSQAEVKAALAQANVAMKAAEKALEGMTKTLKETPTEAPSQDENTLTTE
jgi:hypothetical protein